MIAESRNNISMVGGSTGDARGTSKRIAESIRRVGILVNGITFAVTNFHDKIAFILFVISILAGVVSGNISKRNN